MKILALAVVFAPSLALADPAPVSFELKDRGDAVEVIAHNLKAARTAIAPIRSRLEIPLTEHAFAKPLAPIDPTVKVVELDGGVLSVKLNFERPDVKTLSRYAQAIQVGPDLHMLVPRHVPADGAIVKLPDPTLPPELAQQIAAVPAPKLIGPELPPQPKPTAATTTVAAPAAKSTALPAPAAGPPAPPAAAPAQAQDTKPAVAAEPDDRWSNFSMYAALGLAAAGCGLWLIKRKKAQQGPMASIEVIAQRSLGGKAKIVWLAAGPREMIVAVTAQQVRMLGQWRKTESGELRQTGSFAAVLPEATAQLAQLEGRTSTRDRITSQGFASPAVSGLLQLRAKTQPPPINEDVATGDPEADAAWTREILAATGARR